MANGGRIDYTVGFKVDQSGLNQIKANLTNIQQGSTKDFIGLKGLQDADKKLIEIKKTASDVEAALNRSFNSNLGTLNISKFNQELKKLDIKKVYTDFSQLGPVGQNAFRNITSQILTTNLQLKQTNKWLDEMAITMANSVKWGVTSSIWNNMTGAVEKAWNFAKKLDTSLNDIRIVTQKSADDMERYAIAANKAAKNLGQTTTQYTNASLIYYQQGLSDAEVQTRTETTLKAANVTGQSAAEVSEQLTAVWNGYKVNAQEAELYVDKLSAVAATTAADLEELSTGMSKVASAANIMGVDIDQLNAQLATVVSVTRQAPESVGTAFKTIYARMGDIEAGLDTETSLGEYTEKMNEMGFNVLDTNGKLKDMGSVIEEIGNKWTSLSREQQVALSQTMAGTRQYNNLLALFDNWDMYSKSIETSKNATGALQRQQDIYMESMEAHLQQLQTAGEGVYNALFNAEDFNPIIDALTGVVSLFKNFVDAAGGAQGILLLLGNTAVSVFSKQIASGLATTIANFKTAKENANQLQAEMEILSKYENANINDSRTQDLINMKRQILDYDKVITAEERNQANEIIRQTNELYKQQDLLEKKKAQVQEVAFRYTGLEINLSDQNARETLVKDLEEDVLTFSNYLKTSLSGSQDNPSTLSASIAELQRLKKALDGTRESQQAYSEAIQKVANQVRFQKTGINNLIDTYKLSSEQQEKLTNAVQKYDTAIQQSGRAGLKNAQAVASAKEMHEAYIQVLRELIKDGKMSIDVLQGLQKNQDNLNNSLTAGQQAWKQYLNQIDLKAKAQQIVNFANMLGKVSMTFTSLGRIGDIFKDVNLSSGEKLLQIMSALSMSIPGIISLGSSIGNITGLTDAFNAKIALSSALKRKDAAATAAQNAAEQVKLISGKHLYSLSKSQLAVLETESWMRTQSLGTMTAEELQQATNNFLAQKNIDLMSTRGLLYDAEIKKRYANATALAAENGQQDLNNKLTNISLKNFGTKIKDLWGKFNGLRGGAKLAAGAIGAIAIVAAGTALTLNLVNKGFKDAEEAAKKSAESLNTLTESYNTAKAAFENFQNDISDYSEAKIALEEMATGTEEWKNAVQDVNEQVIDLISNYKELAPYVQRDSQGNLSISNEGLKVAEQIEQEKLNNEYQQLMAARAYDAKAQSEYQRYQTKEELETFGDFEAGFSTVTAGAIGTAIGAAIGTAGGPLGMIIGAAIGTAVGGLVVAIGENTNIQESQIEAVTDAYSKYGEELFSNYDNFETIMRDSSNLTQSEIDALWSNKDSLIELAHSVDANTQAQQTYMQQYAQAALEGNEIYESSENKEDLEKMVSSTSNKNLDEFVDKWKDKLGGKTDEEIQKAYAKLMKWETTSIDNQTGNKATYYFKDGTSKTIDDAIARYALAMAEASEDAVKSLQDFQFALDSINTKLINQGLDTQILSSFYNGEVGDFSNYTQKEIESLMEIKDSFTEEDIIGRGYNDLQNFKNKLEEAQNNYNNWLKDTINETKEFIGENNFNLFSSIMSEENNRLSLTANKNLSKAIQDAFKYGGEEGINSLSKLINDIPEFKLEEFLNIIGNIDFTNADSFDILIKNLKDLNIEMSNKEGWDNWSFYIEQAINNNQSLESSIDRLIKKYQNAAEVLSGLSFGDIIGEEGYQKIIKQYEGFEDFFVKVGEKDGENQYRFVGSDREEIEEAQKEARENEVNEYKTKIKQERKNQQSQENLSGSEFKENKQILNRFFNNSVKKSEIVKQLKEQTEEYASPVMDPDFSYDRWYQLLDDFEQSTSDKENDAINAINEYRQEYEHVFGSNFYTLKAPYATPEEDLTQKYNELFVDDISWESIDPNQIKKQASEFLKDNKQDLININGFTEEYLKTLYDEISNTNDPSELTEIINNFYNSISEFLNTSFSTRNVEKENLFLTQTTSLKELNSLFSQGIGTIDTYLKQYQYLSRDMAIAAGVEEGQIQLYKEKLAAINGVTDAMAEEAASRILLSQIGLNDLADNWEDQLKKLTTLNQFSPDYAKTLNEVQISLSQIFGVEKDLFDAEFIQSHQQDITKMLQGDEEAFDRVGDAIVDKAQNKVSEILGNQAKSFNNLVNSLQEELDTLEFGDSLNKLGNDYADLMAQMLIDSGATASDIIEIFSSMGISINEAWIKAKQIATMYTNEQYEAIVEQYGTEEQKNQIKYAKLAESGVKDFWLWSSLKVKEETEDEAIERIANEIYNSVQNDTNNTPVYMGSKELLNNLLNDNDNNKSKSKKDYLEEDRDRYHDINVEIKKLTNNLEDLKTAEEHLTGKDLINNLNQQLKILDKTVARQREKLKIQRQEQKELQAQLKSQGVQFDKDGTIANYNAILDSQMQIVNNAIAYYNSLSGEGQEAYEETLEAIEKNYKKFKEKIERYEELVYDDMQDLEQEIADNISEQISLKIQAFDETVKIELDFTDAEKSWIDFKKELDLAESDIFGRSKFDIKSIKQLLEDIKTYQWSADTTIQDYKEGKAGSENSRFYVDGVFDEKAAMEALKEEQENLQNALLDANQKINEVQRSYLDMLDQVQEKLDKQMAGYEHINELINHGLKLTELLSGEDSYKEKSTYYSKMATNYKDQIDMASQEKDLWAVEIARAKQAVIDAKTDQEREIAQEQLDKVVENWRNATNELNSLVETAIENLKAQYENSIDQALQEMTEKFTNGKSLDYISKEWELINDNADRYLDTVNSTYEVQALEAKYMNAIDSTDSISAQKKLNQAMEEELAALREKDKLTQYDIDRANKKLDITMKQIALEEAQANKSTMRLRRDAQGNYSYQFVADEDEIAKAQQDLLAAQNDLYNFDKEAYEKNLDEAYQAYVEFQEDLKEAAMINDPEERAAQEALIREQYEQKITDLTAINETIRSNLQSSAFESLFGMYNTNEENFKLMNDNILADFSTLTIEDMPNLMGQLVEGWNTSIQHMITSFAGEDGFSAQCQTAYDAIKTANDIYQTSLTELEAVAGKTFKNIEEDINKDIDKTNDFIDTNEDLIDQIENDLNKQWQLMINTLAKLRESYEELEAAAKDALDEMMRIQDFEHKENTIIKDDNPTKDNQTSPNSPSNPANNNNNKDQDKGKKKQKDPSSDEVTGIAAAIWRDGNAAGWYNGATRYERLTEKFTSEGQKKIQSLLNRLPITNDKSKWTADQKKATDIVWSVPSRDLSKYYYDKFDTGGYTGEWGAEGRMAMLHEKEIVLNKQDTANILNAVSIVRGIGDLINNLSANLLGNLSQRTIDSTLGMRDFEQNVHITAEFPNVSSSSEIEDALRNLTNVAAQRAFSTRV